MFVSHETYTPARGGSAQAEIDALRFVFGDLADQIVITNTKGFTGHAMGVGIEDVVAVKALETGIVPPVPNFKEVDPDLGSLNLSQGGTYPVRYALRLGAGFGSQISMTLYRLVPSPTGGSPAARSARLRVSPRRPRRVERSGSHRDRHRGRSSGGREADSPGRDDGPPAGARHGATASGDSCRPLGGACRPAPLPAAPVATPTPAATRSGPSAPVTPAVARQPAAAPVATAPLPHRRWTLSRLASWSSSPSRPGIRPTCSTSTSTSKPTSASTPSNRPRRSPPSARSTTSPATTTLALRDYPTLNAVISFVYGTPPRPRPDARRQKHPDVGTQTRRQQLSLRRPPLRSPHRRWTLWRASVLEMVTEQTGYPPDMLDLELDLEADLGIDTVKQAETFAAIREEYDIPRDDNVALRDYPTLNAVIRFVREHRPDLAQTPDVRSQPPMSAPRPQRQQLSLRPCPLRRARTRSRRRSLAVVAAQTGYPPDMLDLELDLEADLGIDTVKQAETFAAIREEYDIPRDDDARAARLPDPRRRRRFVYERRPDLVAAAPAAPTPPVVAETPDARPRRQKHQPRLRRPPQSVAIR